MFEEQIKIVFLESGTFRSKVTYDRFKMIVFFRHLVAVSKSYIISESKRIPKMLKPSKLVAEQFLRNCPFSHAAKVTGV